MSVLTAQRGLVTLSSELARPDGAMVVADNIVIDADNTIQQRRGFKEYSSVFPSTVKQVITYKNKLITHYENLLAVDNGNGTFTDFGGNFSELVQGLRIKYIEASGSCFITTSTGIKKISVKDIANISSAVITDAGGVKAIDLEGKAIPNEAGFLPPQSKVSYKLVFGTKDPGNNLVLGSPSPRVVLTNISQSVKKSEIFTVNIISLAAITDGMFFTFDVQDQGYVVWFKKTADGELPVTAATLGRQYIEVDIQNVALTVEDVAALTATAITEAASSVLTIELTGTEVAVTITNPGDVTDVSQGTLPEASVKITKIFDGSITEGISASAVMSFALPSRVTTDYFYQLYRTEVATVSAGVTINDIDPGDEHNYIYEAPITADDILAGAITVEDNTPETFRASGAYLYTNPINGQGILQANERPPIAHDIASFRNSTFYSNTKDVHRLTFSMLSVDDFSSGNTKFYISKNSNVVEYSFVGERAAYTVEALPKSTTIGSTYFTLNTNNNSRSYYFWLDKGTLNHSFNATTAVDSNSITVNDHGFATNDLISFFGVLPTGIPSGVDLYAIRVDANTFKVSESIDGPALSISDSVGTCQVTHVSVDPAIPAQLGVRVPLELYEDSAEGSAQALIDSVLTLSDFDVSSLGGGTVEIISADAGEVDVPVNSTIPSGWVTNVTTEGDGEDVDAKEVLLSNISSTAVSIDLTARSLVKVINRDASSPVTAIYLSGPDDLPGKILLEAKELDDMNFYIGISSAALSAEFTPEIPEYISGTFPDGASSDNNKAPNRIYYSKVSQPEAVPLPNYIDVGSKDKEILRILPLRDSLFVLKEDGIFVVTGQAAPNFSVKLLDNSATLIAPDTAVVLNNLIFCLTTQGIVSISDSGVSIVARSIEDQIKKVTTFSYSYAKTAFGVAYESDRAYLIWLPTNKSDTVATQCFRFNSITNTWTRWTKTNTCGLVNTSDDRLYLGSGDNSRRVIEQERKDGERQDYADRDFALSINNDAIGVDGLLGLSNTSQLEAGDVVVQEQYLTVSKLNRFLKILNKDVGAQDKTYINLLAKKGDNLANTMLELANKLSADEGLSGTFEYNGTTSKESLRDGFNLIVDELNKADSGTFYKQYKKVSDLITYETLITEVFKDLNKVSLNFVTNFIVGGVRIYKAIKSEVQWAPQHFGKPDMMKQVTTGTLIFDQGSIYGATVSYSSDRSAAFVDIAFTMNSPGFWASYPWAKIVWGGGGNDVPLRTFIPSNKSRCRYMNVKFKHSNAREGYKLVGVSLDPREVSDRGYR